MKKIILSLTILLTLAGTLLVPASVFPGGWSSAAAETVTTNDNNQIINYSGSWTHEDSQTGYIEEDRHISSTTNDYAEFKFYGVGVQLFVGTDINKGNADIYIDNVFDSTVDLYAATPQLQAAIYTKSALTRGTHKIKVKVKGTKNASSSGYEIDIDAFRFDDGAGLLPPTNEIQCRTQQAPQLVCSQVDTTHITIIATAVRTAAAAYPAWHLNTGGIGTLYFKLTAISVHWTTNPWSGSGTMQLRFDSVTSFGGGSQVVTVGTYHPSSSGTIAMDPMDAQETLTSAGDKSSYVEVTGYSYPHWYDSTTYVLDIQTRPFEDQCLSQYVTLMTAGPFLIDPTIEAPLGPTGSPPDEQIYPTTHDALYMIRIGGDPWHDGTTADQDGASYSWDGTTWEDLKTANECFKLIDDGNYMYAAVIQAPEDATQLYLRAGDDPGDFADNYMDSGAEGPEKFTYTLSIVVGENTPDCESQYNYDPEADWIASAVVPASVSYVSATDQLIPGDWYVIQIASGSWKDDGAGDDRYDAQFSFGSVTTGGPDGAIWNNIDDGGTGVYCYTEDGNYVTIYTQADNSEFLYLRVHDDALTFTANTGQLGINIYHTSFTPKPSECELNYGLNATAAPKTEIPADQQNGVTVGWSSSGAPPGMGGGTQLEPGGWYKLVTTDGPWAWLGATHSDMSYDLQILWGGDWVPLESWTESPCNVQIDALGHRAVYFQAPTTGGAAYTLRVADTELWYNNINSMGVEIYTVNNLGYPPPDGGCDFTYDQDHPVTAGDIWIPATAEDGEYTPTNAPATLTAGSVYAFVIRGNTTNWHEQTGGDPLYAMQISDDLGATWSDLPEGYGPVLCYINNGNDLIMFIKYGYNYTLKMRVDSDSFANNLDGMNVAIYPAMDPWSSCTEGLALHPIEAYEQIDVTAEAGEKLLITPGYIGDQRVLGYVVKVVPPSGPWLDGETETAHYDIQLSPDNGTTWGHINKDNADLICAKLDLLRHYWTVYFGYTDGQIWKIRVHDDDTATFSDNTGNLAYALYAVTEPFENPDCLVETNNPLCIPPDVPFSINGIDVCLTAPVRPVPPTGIDVPAWLDWLGGWIGYATHVSLQFIAWCPKHSQALFALLNVFKDKEPIATMLEIDSALSHVQTELEGYNWDDTDAEPTILTNSASGGAASNSIWNRLFPAAAQTPWNGGPLITMTTWTGSSRFDRCVTEYTEIITNQGLTQGICFVSSAAIEVGGSFILQILLELSAIGLLITSLIADVRALFYFMAGGQSD